MIEEATYTAFVYGGVIWLIAGLVLVGALTIRDIVKIVRGEE